MMVKGWLGGLGMGGQRHIDLIQDMDYVGSGGRFGNGRANIYILDNRDKSRLEKGWVGGLGMGGHIYNDFIEKYGWCWEWREGWEWEGKCIQIGIYNRGQIYDGEGMVGRLGMGGQRHIDLIEDMDYVGSGGRFGNGRANIYILENMDKSMLEKGGVGGLGMGEQRYNDLIEIYGWCWEWREVWEWEGKYIHIRKYGQIYAGEGRGGRVGNGRAKI